MTLPVLGLALPTTLSPASTEGDLWRGLPIQMAEVDILCPCALGGLLTAEAADSIQAWAVCGAANNIVADDEAERRLVERDILFVPDFISSAGVVIQGIATARAGGPAPLIDRVRQTARDCPEDARNDGRLPAHVATAHAFERIRAAKTNRSYRQGRS